MIHTRQDALMLFAGWIATAARRWASPIWFGSDAVGLAPCLGHGDSVTVPVARIARDAILMGAATVLIAHNHPDGDLRPSAADLALTRRLAQGLRRWM